jgi:hypothetical protein
MPTAERSDKGLLPLTPNPFSRDKCSASLPSEYTKARFRLTKSITSSDNLKVRRRFAPMVIDRYEIVDRFREITQGVAELDRCNFCG